MKERRKRWRKEGRKREGREKEERMEEGSIKVRGWQYLRSAV